MKLPSLPPILAATFGFAALALMVRPEIAGREIGSRDESLRAALDQLGILEERDVSVASERFVRDDGVPQGMTGKLLRGLLPTLLHPRPRLVCLLGIGTGRAAYMAAVLPEIDRVRCIEADPERISWLSSAAEMFGDPVVKALLDLPHLSFEVGDLRDTLARQRERFDVIQAVPWELASRSPEYSSEEFLRLCRGRMASGGYLCNWIVSEESRANLRKVFPHGIEFADPPFAIASDRPITWDANWIVDQFRRARLRDHMLRASIDPSPLRRLVEALRVTAWKPGDQLPSQVARTYPSEPPND